MRLKEQVSCNYSRLICRDILSSSHDKKMNFLEMFQDYEEYHKEINTGKKIRAELIKGWIEKIQPC